MKTKRLLAALLAVLLLISGVAGCGYNPDVVMTVGDIEIPSGVFLMMQLTAYYNAQTKVSGEVLTDMSVLDTIIEDKPARDWINDETDRMVREYAFIESEFDRLGLEMDDMTIFYAEYYAQSTWESDSSLYQENGISYDTLLKINYNSMMRSQLMEVLYGEGGEREIPAEEKEAYFNEHYTRVDYLRIPVVDIYGAALSDEDMQQMTDIAQAMVTEANNRGLERAFLNRYELVLRLTGEITDETEEPVEGEDAIEEEPIVINAELYEQTASLDILINDKETTLPTGFYTEVLQASTGGYYLYVDEDGTMVIYRRNAFHEDDSYETYKGTILVYLAQDIFTEMVSEEAAKMDMVQNDRARKYYSPDKVVL